MDLSKMKQTQQELNTSFGGKKEFAVAKTIKGGGVNNLFRIVDCDDYAKCQRSWIVCDDGTPRPFTVVDRHGNVSPLLKLLGDKDDYYKGGILESIKGNDGKAAYKYDQIYPELITRLGYNGNRASTNGNAKPQNLVLYQIIDRDLYEFKDESGNTKQIYWCKENKHTMLLWIKPTAFDTLVTTVEGNGDPVEYDCTYIKSGSGKNTTHIIQKAGPLVNGVVVGFLTDEEKGYSRYNIEEEAGLARAGYVLFFLSKLIQELDAIFGYNVYEELKAVAALEKKEQSDENEVDASTEYEADEDTVSDLPTQELPLQGAPAQATPQTPVQQPAQAQAPQPAPAATAAPKTRGTAVKKATDMITCLHQGCGKDVPADAEVCPFCNNLLQSPCDSCGQKFSVFAKVCPHCGQIYGDN